MYSQETLAARRRHRRRMHRRRRVAATVLAGLLLALVALVVIPRGSGASYSPPAEWFVHRERVFPKPDRLARLPYVAVAGRHGREVALTFDDGPGPYTAEVVKTLRRLHAPGTFFQVGATEHYFTDAEELQRQDPLVTVGVHTVNHRRLDRLSRTGQAAEIDGDTAILTAAGMPRPTLFRPPYGAYDDTTLALLKERGMTMVLWSVDSHDYLRPGVDAIVARVLSDVEPGAIVLLHDAGGERSQTIEALPRIVLGLRRRHYTLVSVPQLLRDAPPPLAQPKLGVGAG
jgi:peptidoglycan/xylan/chitin deacetylase (PgdA/CDA1 family)